MAQRWAAASPPAAAIAAVAAVGLAYAPAAEHAVGVWSSDSEFSFAFLVPPIAVALVAMRWRRIVAAAGAGHQLGLVLLVAGLVALVAGARADVHALAGASLLPVVLGAVVYAHGVGPARLLALPVGLVAGGLALYRGLLSSVGFALQQVTATAAAGAASALGTPVRRSGVDLFSGNLHLVVAESCSGMDSLLALLCLGALFVGAAEAPPLRRGALMALVLPIIVVANVVRVTLVLLLSRPFGAAAAEGLRHEFLSASLFLAATLLFLAAGLFLRCVPSFAVRPSSPS